MFCYALAAVVLGLAKMILTIWMYRNDDPDALRAEQEKHQTTAALLDVFTPAFGAPAAFFGALSFLVSG